MTGALHRGPVHELELELELLLGLVLEQELVLEVLREVAASAGEPMA